MKLNISLTLFIFLTPFVGHCLNCASLKSGESVRIDQAGGSLEHFRIQDQDGLGTCYANATSAILQSVLPEHPELSYLQIASINAEQRIAEQQQKAGNTKVIEPFAQKNTSPNSDLWDLTMDGGDICTALDNVKKAQAIKRTAVMCPKSKTNLEELYANGDNEKNQYQTILQSSKYMNLFQNSFQGQKGIKKYSDFRDSFKKMIEEKKNQLARHDCREPINSKGLEALLHPMLAHEMSTLSVCNDHPEYHDLYMCKISSVIIPDAVKKNEFQFTANHVGAPLLNGLKKILVEPNKNFNSMQMRNDIKAALMSVAQIPNENMEVASTYAHEAIDSISEDKIQEMIQEIKEIKSTGTSAKCLDRSLVDYISQGEFEADWSRDRVLCGNQDLMKQATAVALEYDNSGLKEINNVVKFLEENAGLPYQNAIMSLFAKDCLESDKINISPNLTCKKTLADARNKRDIDKDIFSNLKNNKAIGLKFCSSVIDNPNVSLGEACGQHAVFIKGMKCENGKYKYLIQNSWGKDIATALNPAIQTENADGSYWFSENTFYDSAISIQTIKDGNR